MGLSADSARDRRPAVAAGCLAALVLLLMVWGALFGTRTGDVLARAVSETRRHTLRPASFQLREVRYQKQREGLLIAVDYLAESAGGKEVSGTAYYRWRRQKDLLAPLLSDYDRCAAEARLRAFGERRALPGEAP